MAGVVEKIKQSIGGDTIIESLKYLNFGILKIGKTCNAVNSVSFTSANCDLSPVFHRTLDHEPPLGFKFQYLFSPCFDLISHLLKGTRKFEDLSNPHKEALRILDNYLGQAQCHLGSLVKVLLRDEVTGKYSDEEKLTETDVTAVLAEHLLGKLAPGKTYTVYRKSMNKGGKKCRCGCSADINYGDTGIGNENVWHGFLDVIFASQEDCAIGAVASSSCTHEPPVKKRRLEDVYKEDEVEEEDYVDSPVGGKSCAEVKISFTDDIEDQAAAQAIVFSLLQKQRHPEFSNHFIPTIVISSDSFRIFMYDAQNDVLVRSAKMDIYVNVPKRRLALGSIIVLWAVLHYRVFCSGIDVNELTVDINDIKSGFLEHVSDMEYYSHGLMSDVGSFRRVEKTHVLNDFIIASHLFLVAPKSTDDNEYM